MVNEAYRRLCDIYVTLAGFLLKKLKNLGAAAVNYLRYLSACVRREIYSR
jgi:hypothetical protein